MLQNREKYARFFDVLRRITPGKVVLDVGAGSGILSLLAVAGGAQRVVAVERPSVAGFAAELLSMFPNWAPKVELVARDFFDFSPRERFDVLIAELIGYLGFEEDVHAVVSRARTWCPTCAVVPGALSIILYPTQMSGEPPLRVTLDMPYSFPATLIRRSPPSAMGRDSPYGGWSEWQASERFQFNAIGVAVIAELTSGIEVTNWHSDVWPRAVVALGEWITVDPSEIVQLRLELDRGSEAFFGYTVVSVNRSDIHTRAFRSSEFVDDGKALAANFQGGPRMVAEAAAEIIVSLTSDLD